MTDVATTWQTIEAGHLVRDLTGKTWKVLSRTVTPLRPYRFELLDRFGYKVTVDKERMSAVTRVEWGMDEAVALVASILPVTSTYEEV